MSSASSPSWRPGVLNLVRRYRVWRNSGPSSHTTAHFCPIAAPFQFDLKRYSHSRYPLHFLFCDLGRLLQGFLFYLDKELIMDLHDHRSVHPALLNLSMQSYHRHLYQVRRAPLNGGIDGYPLGLCPSSTHRSIQLRQVAPASKHRRDVAVLASTVQGFPEPRAYPRQSFEVSLDIVRGLGERNAQFT